VKTPRDNVEEVSPYLAAARAWDERLTQHIERVRAVLTRFEERSAGFARSAAHFEQHIARVSAFLEGESEPELRAALLAAADELEAARRRLLRGAVLLEREHAKHLDAFERDPVARLITDRRALVCEANAAAAALLGVPQSSVPGRLLIAFIARQDVQQFRDFTHTIDPVKEETEERVVTLRIRPRGHGVRPARLSVRALRGTVHRGLALRWLIEPANGLAVSA
jgi:PAS domain-containing protein